MQSKKVGNAQFRTKKRNSMTEERVKSLRFKQKLKSNNDIHKNKGNIHFKILTIYKTKYFANKII